VEYPELAARTRGFTAGAPRAVSVSADGQRVFFLRSGGSTDLADALWVFDVATATERIAATAGSAGAAGTVGAAGAVGIVGAAGAVGIGSYATDSAGSVAAFAADDRLTVVTVATGDVVRTDSRPGVVDPRPDPSGRRVGYVSAGALHVVDLATGRDTLIAGEPDNPEVTWGLADFIGAEEFGRTAGYWWAPDGMTVLAARVDTSRVRRWRLFDPSTPEVPPASIAYPTAGTPNAEVSLHLLDLDGGWVDVHWDRETYPYLVCVSWAEAGGPLITVLRRLQQHGLVLAVDPRTGETQVHAELADPRWVDPVPGTPTYLSDGRVLLGGELGHDGYDARCLFADGALLTPASLYIRRVCGRLGDDLLVEASEAEPSERHLYRVVTRTSSSVADVRRLTPSPGWHVGHAGGHTLVVGAQALDHTGTEWTVQARGVEVGRLASVAAPPSYAPRPSLDRVTDRRLPTGVLYPRGHVTGRRLPVLVDVYGGPGHQEVVAARASWLERQWWADAGFAVVVIDNRGTPGVAPSFEKVIHRRFADVMLTDQVDALAALGEKHPDLDLARVAIRGSSFGGWLAALAVLRRPDVYRCGVARAPVTDWTLYDTAYSERYLGLPDDTSDLYAHASLLEWAAEAGRSGEPARPLLLIHGLLDATVLAAHTLRLSAALLAAGAPHAMIPLTGAATSPAAGGPARRDLTRHGLTRHDPTRQDLDCRLLRQELDFIRRCLA
jgi:dipeptidyl-peptidase-4